MNEYTIKSGDNLYNIAKKQYSLTNDKDIKDMVYKIANDNNIKNPNLIFSNQKIELKEELNLNSVSVFNSETGESRTLKPASDNKNYYRQDDIFGNIATKSEEYPDEQKTTSNLKAITQATPEVEDVVVDIKGQFTSKTARDAQAFDIAAKPAGVEGFKDMKNTDAYKLFLEVNADDFTVRETTYNGKTEQKAYLDSSKTDGKITVFSSEIIDGKEYLAMRDKEGKIHYFDKTNNLSEYKMDDTSSSEK